MNWVLKRASVDIIATGFYIGQDISARKLPFFRTIQLNELRYDTNYNRLDCVQPNGLELAVRSSQSISTPSSLLGLYIEVYYALVVFVICDLKVRSNQYFTLHMIFSLFVLSSFVSATFFIIIKAFFRAVLIFFALFVHVFKVITCSFEILLNWNTLSFQVFLLFFGQLLSDLVNVLLVVKIYVAFIFSFLIIHIVFIRLLTHYVVTLFVLTVENL